MDTLTAKQILFLEFRGAPNVVTPLTLETGLVHHRVAYELSQGEIFDNMLYGVTFAGVDDHGHSWRAVSPFSSVFSSEAAARAHISRVREFLGGHAHQHVAKSSVVKVALMALFACALEVLSQDDNRVHHEA